MDAGQLLDRMIAVLFPGVALRRAAARSALASIRSYDAGRINRNTQNWNKQAEAGDSPRVEEVLRVRARAWNEWRNSSHARKIGRSIRSKVIGTGLVPKSIAQSPDGEANDAFRRRARRIWNRWAKAPMTVGRPGQGGLSFVDLSHLALHEVIYGGEVLIHHRLHTREQARARRLAVGYTVTLIEGERLQESATQIPDAVDGSLLFRGVECDQDYRRLAYHILDHHPQSAIPGVLRETAKRIDAQEIQHLYIPERTSQLRGVSWLAPVLGRIRDIRDYNEAELVAANISACMALFIKSNSPVTRGISGNAGASDTDGRGNTIERLEPGMIRRLAPGEEVESFLPNRPNSQAGPFMTAMLHGVATGMPGVKASTITGDYRGSSFSSEKSSDNDTWPEIEELQGWFAAGFLQPVYERVLLTAWLEGQFADVLPEGLDLADPENEDLLAASWHGPVARSINPLADEQASSQAIRTGTSSLPIEAANRGYDWLEILDDVRAVLQAAEEREIPAALIYGLFGLQAVPSGDAVVLESTGDLPDPKAPADKPEPTESTEPEEALAA